ncbi:MAG: glutamyl-tRNA reductase [Planctomycetes bacterium]|nr:glutamyl-tRNA reductase [Planctomycetota bacterium]
MGEAGGTAPSLPFVVFGVDHHRTPVELREKLAVPIEGINRLLALLSTTPGASEAVVLSTCNRLECYLAGTPDRQQVITRLAEHQGVDAATLDAHAFWHPGMDGVRHLFRVVSGLESLVLGEYQIVHQVKTGYDIAHQGKFTGAVLNPLFQRALGVAKDVRNNTAIGKFKLSVASVAVDLAKHIHGEVERARLLVVGAGEIAELAVRYLLTAGVRELTIINRNEDRAHALAEEFRSVDFVPQVLPWSMLSDALTQHDIVVTSTAAPHAVITVADVKQAMRRRRQPLMFMDLAVPRDVEPSVGELSDVYLYNIDHLEQVVSANQQLRRDEVDAASALVDSLVTSYATDVRHDRGALMAQVAGYFADVIAAEEARLVGKLGLKDNPELKYGLERIGNKLQHQLLKYLRDHAHDPQAEKIIREILGL